MKSEFLQLIMLIVMFYIGWNVYTLVDTTQRVDKHLMELTKTKLKG